MKNSMDRFLKEMDTLIRWEVLMVLAGIGFAVSYLKLGGEALGAAILTTLLIVTGATLVIKILATRFRKRDQEELKKRD